MPEEEDPIEHVRKKTRDLIKKHGFAVHSVFGGMTLGCVNAHTHGLLENFQHKELQIVLPIDPETIQSVLHCAVDLIRAGTVFEDGKTYSGVLKGLDVRFIATFSNGAECLRMILPDSTGNLEKESMPASYKAQYDTEEFSPNRN